jgi:dTDP-4-dehydrorhamnose reductase
MNHAGNVLVTGAEGQLGSALLAQKWPPGLIPVYARKTELDITDASAVERLFAEAPICAVINAAAYTRVDEAETAVEAACSANVGGPRILARCCRQADVPLLHVSTDFVFDGRKPTPYTESDAPNPLSVYGQTKRAGELAVTQVWPKHIILRVAWSYGLWGRNFVTAMLDLAVRRPEVAVVADQIGAPTHHADIAEALLLILDRARSGPQAAWGTFHFTNGGSASRFEVAARIFEALRRTGIRVGRVVPVPTEAYPTPAQRPLNSRLDTAKFQAIFGHRPAPWQERLDSTLAEFLARGVGVPVS